LHYGWWIFINIYIYIFIYISNGPYAPRSAYLVYDLFFFHGDVLFGVFVVLCLPFSSSFGIDVGSLSRSYKFFLNRKELSSSIVVCISIVNDHSFLLWSCFFHIGVFGIFNSNHFFLFFMDLWILVKYIYRKKESTTKLGNSLPDLSRILSLPSKWK
jgi:hypothetical protein